MVDPTSPSELVVTHRSEVTDDQIDHLGHMNVRFYGVNAHAGSLALAAALGIGEGPLQLTDTYTRHHREQLAGARLQVHSGVLDADADGLRLYHELVNAERDEIAATFIHRIEPVGASLPADVVSTARSDTVTVPEHGRPRSVDLDADPVASAPSLEDVVGRDLAMRHPRAVTSEECDAGGDYIPSMAPMLTWGGEAIEDGPTGPFLIDGPNGEKMGWATMESRLSTPRLPRLGDRIQSFGANVTLTEKVSHRVQWAFDVDRGDLLCTFQVVMLAFDTLTRRSMPMPAEVRALFERDFHPDLAPTASRA